MDEASTKWRPAEKRSCSDKDSCFLKGSLDSLREFWRTLPTLCMSRAFAWVKDTYAILCFVDRASRYNYGKWPTWRTILFSYMFISILYMFRAASCCHNQENQLYQYNIWYMSLCVSDHLVRRPDLRSRRSLTQSDIYQTLYWYNWFSWWWARGCSKRVENWNKHIRKKNCVSSWSFTRIRRIFKCSNYHGWSRNNRLKSKLKSHYG
jgi:hypothetical protein